MVCALCAWGEFLPVARRPSRHVCFPNNNRRFSSVVVVVVSIIAMGAGASTADKVELQRAYAAWTMATAPGQPELTDKMFLELLKAHAPCLHAKATEAGTGEAAAAGLKAQFETAKRKLKMRTASDSGTLQIQTPAPLAPPPLQKLYSWAPDKGTNLQRGLAAAAPEACCCELVTMCILEHFGEDLPVPDGVVHPPLLRRRRLVGALRCKEGRDGCLPVAVRAGMLAERLQRRRAGTRRRRRRGRLLRLGRRG